MQEEWKSIYFIDKGILYDYRGIYWVSNTGRVKAKAVVSNKYHKKGEIYEVKYRYNTRKQNKHGGLGGYCIVALYKNGLRKDIALHRIVINVFSNNPNNLPQVNHIDGNKRNNAISNLEWCTNGENQTHAFKMGLRYPKKGKDHPNSSKIIQYDLKGNFIKIWDTIHDAQLSINGKYIGSISPCVRNKCKTAYGYKWRYYEEVKDELEI